MRSLSCLQLSRPPQFKKKVYAEWNAFRLTTVCQSITVKEQNKDGVNGVPKH